MEHYVCTECGGVSDSPKACDTEGCSKNGQPLTACNCADGSHQEAKNQDSTPAQA